MANLYDIIDGQSVTAGPFRSWAEAREFQAEHQVPGVIKGYADPTVAEQSFSNPEPQEMTASWARRFARAA
jgi:hypothetical protein